MHDALVIGAGPAGAAAAWALARAGCQVALVDREAFPRDKTCGDGLIPDSLGALATMGLRDAVAREAIAPPALHIVAPGGQSVGLKGGFLCLPRFRLDAVLVEAAVNAGAGLLPPMSGTAPDRRRRSRARSALSNGCRRVRSARAVHVARDGRQRHRDESIRSCHATQAERGGWPRLLQGAAIRGRTTPTVGDCLRPIALPGLRVDLSRTRLPLQRGRGVLCRRSRRDAESPRVVGPIHHAVRTGCRPRRAVGAAYRIPRGAAARRIARRDPRAARFAGTWAMPPP